MPCQLYKVVMFSDPDPGEWIQLTAVYFILYILFLYYSPPNEAKNNVYHEVLTHIFHKIAW